MRSLNAYKYFKATRVSERSTRGVLKTKKHPSYNVSMKYKLKLKSIATLSDDALLRGLSELVQQSRRVEVELVAHIGEVEARRLFAREATSSMYSYCTSVLHLSDHEAYLRIEVARASREHPVLLEMLADGRLHLSGISLLRPHLTEANRETVLKRATHKSKRQIQEIVAELSPKADVPATIRKLPERQVRRRTKSGSPTRSGPSSDAELEFWPTPKRSRNHRSEPSTYCSDQTCRGRTHRPGALQSGVYG